MRKGLNTAAAGVGRKGRGSLINAMKVNNTAAIN
jgi:hypothetical protein